MGCSDSRMAPMKVHLPFWVHSLHVRQEMCHGWGAVSDGMNQLTLVTLVVSRVGNHTTDGARWCVPFTEGKHVFEVNWPYKNNRGSNSCFGVASKDVPLSAVGRVSLPGTISEGWCVDMSRRLVIHTNKPVGRVRPLPDKFFIFVDVDAGKIGVSQDINTLGHHAGFDDGVITGIKFSQADPLYLMVSSPTPRETIEITYKGSHVPQGGFDLVQTLMAAQIAPSAPAYQPPPPAVQSVEKF